MKQSSKHHRALATIACLILAVVIVILKVPGFSQPETMATKPPPSMTSRDQAISESSTLPPSAKAAGKASETAERGSKSPNANATSPGVPKGKNVIPKDPEKTTSGLAPLNEKVLRQISAIEAEKDLRTPAQQKMDSGLVHLAKKSRGEVIAAEAPNLEVGVKANEKGLVLVDLNADVSEELLTAITTAGGKVINQFAPFHAIRAELPVQAIEALAARDDVKSIAPAALAITNVGSVLSQGDRTHRADSVRALYGASGAGIKIGVLSDGVNSLAASKANGNLNALATALPGQAGSGDEGTAMMELIQDLLPDAQLIFATAFNGDTSMAANIVALQAAGCSVIVDDVTYFNESPFQDMVISQAVNTVSAAGAMFFSSARNSGNKNDGTSGTWEGDFVSAGAVAAPVTGTGLIHDFGGATAFNTVAAGGSSRRIDFFWSDPLGASANDYDVFILDSAGATVLRSSTNVQSGTQNAYEASSTLNIGERIVIVQRAGAAGRFLHLDTGRAVLSISTPGNVRGHNASVAANSFSVAATNVANSPSPNFFVGGATNPVETFSSDGPRRMFYDPSGTPLTPGNFSSTGGTVYDKPDITAADGTSTSVAGFTSFFGTSAAAPHAAAIAAMIKSYNPALTPAQIRTAMTSTALDIEAVGSDRDSGVGIVMAYQAVASLPALDDLVVGAASFTATGFVGGPFSPTSATYTLTNLGAVPVNWTASKTQSFTSLSSTSGTLAPGANTTVTWSLDPTANALAVGNYADTLTFTNTATSFTLTKPMTLTVIGYPEIVVEQPEGSGLIDDSSSVAFGNVLAGANLTKRFAIKNIGAGPMTLSGASLNGSHAAEFVLGSFTATNVGPGQTAYLDVSFRPLFPNSKSAALHILSSDVDEPSFDIALTGFGTTPGGPVMLGRDINITPNGLSPVLPVVIGAQEFFLGTTVDAGQELWRTDGSAAGTFMVKDILGGAGSSNSSGLTNFGGTLFFAANNGTNGTELWKSDGTNAGTVLVKDISAGFLNSFPVNMTVIGSSLFFSAADATNGTELWKSDGTAAGTVMIANIATGVTPSNPSNFRAVGSTLFFTANDAINGVELWKSDGTAAGTVLVKDIVAGITSSSPANLTAIGSALFFTVNDTVNGVELWTSDGTAAGTVLVKDINPGITSSSPSSLVEFGGALYFSATTVTEGPELWKSDGTAAGTVMLKDIFAGVSGSLPINFLNAGSTLYFSASDSLGRELWKTDGTSVGTVMVSDIAPGSSSSGPSQLTLIGSVLYFNGAATGLGNELFKTDGTAAGTVMVKDISPGASSSSPLSLVNLGGTLLFAANDGITGIELWKSDGTDLGTVMILDGQTGSSSSAPANLRNVNGMLYLSAFDGINGTELWKSDGTVPGTVLVKDIATGVTSSSPASFSNIGNTLYFSAFDSTNGTEFWKSDGTSLGTVMVSNINPTAGSSSSPSLLTALGSNIFFSATDTTANGAELWKSDGTAAGTVMVSNINPAANTGSSLANLTDFNGTLFFSANDGTNGVELWKSDGTAAGTVLVKDINAGSVSSSPANLRVIGATLYFTATTAANGNELWKSDGTTAGTVIVSDIIAGATSSSPANLAVVGTTLYFSASNGTAVNGTELWKSDGTTAGTVMVSDISSGTTSSAPINLVNVGGVLFFATANGIGVNGAELWKSDGTAAGTVMVLDINAVPTTFSSSPASITNMNGIAYFSALQTAGGREMWKSNGTAAGTVIVTDLQAGTASGNPTNLTSVGNLLFFTATIPELGASELFVLDTTPPEEIQIEQPLATILVDGATTINIGSPALGGSAVEKTFTIKNIGTQTLTITGVSADGADSASFSFPTLVGTNIPAAGSAALTVSLSPTSLGAKTAALHIESTDGDENPFDIALTGTVIALPEIQVEQPAGTIKLDGSSTVALGDSVLGVGVTKTFTISNVGSSALNVTSITIDGANSSDFVTPAFSGSVPNGSSVTFDVTFTPPTTGARAAVLHVNCDDVDESSYDIMLTGIGSAPAGLLKLAKDINQTGAGAGITSMVLMGGSAYFAATTADFGAELWKTDGTAAGTVMVKDINASSNSSSPANLLVIGSTLYFSATNSINGIELWKSDGTNAGTVMVKDIFTGVTSSSPANLTNVGGTLFFSATDTTANGIELWKSDGTTAGTVLVLNINPTANTSSTPTLLTAVGSTLFFSATDTTLNGAELWKSDGTAAGTVLVKDINTTANTGSSLANLTVVGSTLFFSASEATNGTELWKSDGTAVGTVIVKDIFAGVTGSSPAVLANVAGTLFFRANTAAAGTELWKSDGTTVGTLQVKDIFSGTSNSTPASLFPAGPLVYFSATDGVNGIELWKSDGTTVGTVMVADVNSGSASSSPINFTLVGSTLYFAATTASGSAELWQTDGTAANTSLVLDINPGSGASSPGVMLNLGGSLVFVANDGPNGAEIWKSDSTGTSLLKDLTPGTNSASPFSLTLMNGAVYFSASDGVNGTELWRSDGTLAGSIMVKDVFLGLGGSGPAGLTVIGSTLYFSAFDITNGPELWKSDGTAAGTVLVKDISPGASTSSPANLTNINGTLYFSANDSTNGAELWKSDGTAAGTVMVANINPIAFSSSSPANLTDFSGTVFFTANDGTNGTELWKSDGTAAGTVMVLDINVGASVSSSPSNLRVIGSTLFFTATTAANGVELWKSDGTAAGTVIVSDIIAGATGSSPANLTVIGSTLFFSASNGGAVNGTELWKSDGTAAGTVMVKDIFVGTTSSSPAGLINVNGTLFFSASDVTNSVELWKSDGTTAGTVLVKDIAPGLLGSSPFGLVNAYGTVYFRALTAAAGTELWKSDGTSAGTVMATDVRPGALSSTPSNLTVVGSNLFFTAFGPDLGTELWVYDLSVAAVPPEIQVEQPASTILADGAATINFGPTAVGVPVLKTFTLRNLGTQNLTITGITGDGADLASFSFPPLTGAVIAGASSTTFTVTFNPAAAGSKTAAIHIASDDADENPFDIALIGTGVLPAPEIAVEEPVGTGLVDSTATSAFGSVNVGSNSVVKTYTITNLASATANLTGIAVTRNGSTDFVLNTAGTAASLAPGAATTFTVTLIPTSVGAKTGQILIASDDADENPFNIALGGTGVSGSVTNTFSFTGGVQTFVVPSGVTSVTLETFGAQGRNNAAGVVGGLGGSSTGKLAVTPGETLYIHVGSGGTTGTTGGFNGGGDAGTSPSSGSLGGGGGGASDVRAGGTGLNNRVIVAGGGGGAGGNRVATLGRGTGGGGGGGFYGGGGGSGWPGVTPGTLPTGGTQTAGGIGGDSTATGVPGDDGLPGALGTGGKGGDEVSSSQGGSETGLSGGVGGGLTGGNGSHPGVGNFTGQSGAGGSSYLGGVTEGVTLSGAQSGNGLVKITYGTASPGGLVFTGLPITTQGTNYQAGGNDLPTRELSFTPTPGQSYPYIELTNAGNDIIGEFNDLPDGGVVAMNLNGVIYYFQVNYNGGTDGNDLIFTAFTPSAPAAWRWTAGPKTRNNAASFGSLNVAAGSNNPGARQGAMNWRGEDGSLWMFGGYGYASAVTSRARYLNDLWQYDRTLGQWIWRGGSTTQNAVGVYGSIGVEAAGNTPGARHTGTTWTDASGNLWLFGGLGLTGRHNDLWRYNRSTGLWAWMKGGNTVGQAGVYGTQGTAAAANTPGARQGAASWVTSDGNLWLFGGTIGTVFFNDLWSYNLVSGNWTWVSGSSGTNANGTYGTQGTPTAANVPGSRRDASSWVAQDGSLWMFGGLGLPATGVTIGDMNDLWRFNRATGQWTWIKGSNSINPVGVYGTLGTPAAANTPGGRSGGSGWSTVDGKFWLVGGFQNSTHSYSDVWIYDRTTNQWVWMQGASITGASGVYGTLGVANPANKPGARFTPSTWVTLNGTLWIFGGGGYDAFGTSGRLSDLWSYSIPPPIGAPPLPAPEPFSSEFIVNENPDASDASAGTMAYVPIAGQLSAADADDDIILFSSVTSPTLSHGTLNLQANGQWIYIPEPGFIGTDTFSFQASDYYGGQSAVRTLVITVVINPADNDNDGLPDSYEQNLLGGTGADALGDADLDGQSNYFEYLAGTSPVHAAQSLSTTPSVAAGDSSGGGFKLDLNYVRPGVNYHLETSSDLDVWQSIGTFTFNISGSATLEDPAPPTGLPQFYRVSLEPTPAVFP